MKLYSNNLLSLHKALANFQNLDEARLTEKRLVLLFHGTNVGLSSSIIDEIAKKYSLRKKHISMKSDKEGDVKTYAMSESFFGDKEIIIVDDFTNNIVNSFKDFFENTLAIPNIICFYHTSTLSNSGLRKYLEDSKFAYVIACYDEDKDSLKNYLKSYAKTHSISIDDESLEYISTFSNGSRVDAISEIEKLALYCHDQQSITIDFAHSALSLEKNSDSNRLCIYHARKDKKNFYIEYDRLIEDNTSPVLIIRALLRFYMNLYYLANITKEGGNIDLEIKKIQPTIFFKLVPFYKNLAMKLDLKDMISHIGHLQELEVDYKLTGNLLFKF